MLLDPYRLAAAGGGAPPVVGMTGRWDASDASKLALNYQAAPPFYNGAVTDGSSVQTWLPSAGPRSFQRVDAAAAPEWRSTTPLMKLPCLHFNRANSDAYQLYDLTGGTRVGPVSLAPLMTFSNKTIALALYVESLPTGTGAGYASSVILSEDGGFITLGMQSTGLVWATWDANDRKLTYALTLNKRYVFICRHNGVNLMLRVASTDFDWTDVTPVVANPTIGDMSTPARIGMAASSTLTGGSWRLGELITYNTSVTGADLTALSAYLKDKWLP
jgi:hypothetical protein